MVKKKIAFVLAVFCATVLLMAVQKPVFLAYYAADAAQASVGEWLGVVWHGLTLDSTVAGYVTALPLLLALVSAGADRLFRVSRNRHGGHLRCRCRVIPALGLPPRCDDPDLPYRPRGGYGERRFLARGAPDPAGRRLRGAHGLGLPPRLPPVRRGAAPPACGAAVEPCPAAARRVRFPRHPRWAGGFGRQCVKGLFQCEHVSEPCGDQPGLFVPHEPRRPYRLCRRIPLLRRGRTRGTVCPLAPLLPSGC